MVQVGKDSSSQSLFLFAVNWSEYDGRYELRPALDLETGEGKKSEEGDGVQEQFNDDAMPTGKSRFFGSFLGRRKSKKEKTEETMKDLVVIVLTSPEEISILTL